MNQNVTPSTGAGNGTPTRTGDRSRAAGDERYLLPPVDVVEDATGITLWADLPGVAKDKLDLRVDGDTLAIEGEIVMPMPDAIQPSHAEVQLTRYRRSFTLSKELDPAQIAADLKQGVLRVRIPKAEHAQPRRITVNVA